MLKGIIFFCWNMLVALDAHWLVQKPLVKTKFQNILELVKCGMWKLWKPVATQVVTENPKWSKHLWLFGRKFTVGTSTQQPGWPSASLVHPEADKYLYKYVLRTATQGNVQNVAHPGFESIKWASNETSALHGKGEEGGSLVCTAISAVSKVLESAQKPNFRRIW